MNSSSEKIAIVGMSFRLPGGSGDAFWHRLVAGEDLVTEVQDGRWAKERFLHPRKSEPGKSYTFAAGSVPGGLMFDAGFFGISPREAAHMDPQQRFLLEMTWEALENAGLKASGLKGTKCGVFVGISSFDYIHCMADDLAAIDAKTPTGNAGSIAANRISYFLDLKGPSLSVDTACSSSLVALHQAWNSLRLGECETAIVGGISLHHHPIGFISFTKTGMLSPTGRCRTFDASADGYVRSEGGAVILLKSLDNALRDGDRVLAVIEASGINSDGKTNGITVPNGLAQSSLLEQIYEESAISPDALDFVEAHGTGTPVGDPIEVAAIGEVLGKHRAAGRPLPIGSIKSNLGHLEAASGMAGLVKTLLAFRHRVIPPNLHFAKPNPHIDFEDLNLRVVTESFALPEDKRLVAGINSFGFGGTNAHLVLSSPPPASKPRRLNPPRKQLPFVISAKTPKALRELVQRTADFVADHSDVPLYDIAYALAERREWLDCRALCWAEDREDLVTSLRAFASGKESPVFEAEALPKEQKPVFVFTGHGGQWQGMGQALFEQSEVFRRSIEEVDGILRDYAPFSLLPYFTQTASPLDLDRTELVQPLIFALQVGLVRMLMSLGVKPAAVVGHSLGEIAAVWASGALELEQAVKIVRLRSKQQQTAKDSGGMAVVAASRDEVDTLLGDPALDGIEVVVAGENSPQATTVSGSIEALHALEAILRQRGTIIRRLDLPYPFHSHLMDNLVPRFAEELGEVFSGEHSVPFYSAVTGKRHDASPDQTYWTRNIRQPVLFRQAIESAAEDGAHVFVEIGPHPVLCAHISRTLQGRRRHCFAGHLVTKEHHGLADVEEAVNKLVLGGAGYDWRTYFPSRPTRFVELPSYPWQSEEFALPVSAESGGLVSNDNDHPLLGHRVATDGWDWENHFDTTAMPWLGDHRVGDAPVFPAAGFMEMALAAASLRHGEQSLQIEDFEIRNPLILDARRSKVVRFCLDEHDGHFVIKSRERLSKDPWQTNVTGRISRHADRTTPEIPSCEVSGSGFELAREELYEIARGLGLNYGPAFQAVAHVSGTPTVIAARLAVPESLASNQAGYLLHPSMLDGALQSLFALCPRELGGPTPKAFLPVRAGRFVLSQRGCKAASARIAIRHQSQRSILADIFLLDQSGQLVASAFDWRFRAVRVVASSFDRPRILGQRWVERPRLRNSSSFDGDVTDLARLGREAAAEASETSILRRYPIEGDALLDAMCASFALEAFRGLADGKGAVSLAEAKAGGRITDGMADYARRLARMLMEDGLATARGVDEWTLTPTEEAPAAAQIWRSLIADFPEKATRFGFVGRLGLHLGEILDGSRRIEDLLPKWAEVSSGGYALHKSGVKPEMLRLLSGLFDRTCSSAADKPRRILWITGPKPSSEHFLAPWLRNYPGLLTVLLPDASDAQELEERFAAYPEVSTATGLLNESTVAQLTSTDGLFDAVVAPPALSEDQYQYVRDCLLPGGIVAVSLPERSRFEDFAPLGMETGIFPSELTRSSVSRVFASATVVPLSAAAETGPALLFAVKKSPNQEPPFNQRAVNSLVIPLGPEAEPCATSLLPALCQFGSAAAELLPPADAEASSLWADLLEAKKPHRIVFVVPSAPTDGLNPGREIAGQISAISACLRAASKTHSHSTICLLTPGCFTGQQGNGWINASLWGFARVARNEFGNPRLRCIDHEEGTSLKDIAEEIATADSEDEIVLGTGGRKAARVVAEAQLDSEHAPGNERLVLEFEEAGLLQNLRWKRSPALTPARGQLAIAPRAAGLNFRDVMYTMGLLPNEALEGGFAGQTLGMELAGVVTAVGSGVTEFKPGDEVIAFAPASFSSQTVTSTSAVVPKPAELSFAAAATIPTAFYTAYHALVELADLKAGERVLIHGAAGGVGIAAVQLARHIGAEVFATAGNNEKRDFVRLLGADHVFNSRTLEFADGIRQATGGEGVDVILNSLAGEAVTKNLEILRPFGRFLELGKRDFYENRRIGLRPFRHNIRYFAVDADQVMALRPDMAAHGFRKLLELFHRRILSPLPLTVFPASEAAEAFRFMQHSSQTGKVVLDLMDLPSVPPAREASPRPLIAANATYLVSGGWSGFGLETARWLVANGARSLALLGRAGAASEEAKRFGEECNQNGVLVCADPCDITDEQALGRVLAKVRAGMPPLRGVFHAATVIDDDLIVNMAAAKAQAVLAPKVTGAALLDRMTRQDPLDHFVLYSSATTYFGNPGQAAYVAANTAVEELAAQRRRSGLPVTCVSWGAIGDTGYLARHEKIKETLTARTGSEPLNSADALRFLGSAMADGTSQVAWMDLAWSSLARTLPSASHSRYQMLSHLQGSDTASLAKASDLRRELERMSPAELLEVLKGILKEEISGILRVPPHKLDENRSLIEVGMDSLMGVELMTSLENNLGVSVPILALTESPTIARLAERLSTTILSSGNAQETNESDIAAHVRHLASQHAADLSSRELADIAADLEKADKL